MPDVNVLIMSGFGLNCDTETAYAFRLAGAKTRSVHINSLIDGSARLEDFQIMVFIGGFSWADDHGAGVVHAVRLKTNIGNKILEFVAQGNLVLGICNGFQALANLGLLPGFNQDYTQRSVALTINDCGNFRNQWVYLKPTRLLPVCLPEALSGLSFRCATEKESFMPTQLRLPVYWKQIRSLCSMLSRTEVWPKAASLATRMDRCMTSPESVTPPAGSSV